MFQKVLIANRGEIAVRIIRACREMGIATVAVFSEPDRDALHTQLADEAVCIGPAKATDSYLNMQNIISAAVSTKAQAIHPGFGFLAENSIFAGMCAECNIKFIGPSSDIIDAMGNKSNARELMIKAGVPVIPGSDGVVESVEKAKEVAKKLGYPVAAGIDAACRDQLSIGLLPVGINRWRFLTPLRNDITAKIIIQPSLYHNRY